MKRASIVGIFIIAMMASVLMPLTVKSQQKSLKDQIVGTWIYVSSTAKRDDGSYEPRPSLQGVVTYTASTFPNFVGAPNQRRIVTSITADEMKFTNPRTPAGLTLEIVWKRAK